jgi:predicted CoA-substrate-specific enzyme activase
MDSGIKIGLDIGSTTIKVVVTGCNNSVIFKDYRRHYADIEAAVLTLMNRLSDEFGNRGASFCITGSAGMGVAEKSGISFVQEVVAACEVISSEFPDIRTFVDIGGEDSKMIFFNIDRFPDMRMNGNCAGGTGSFIDQVASLLNTDPVTLNDLAEKSSILYPISSRCGVFCKTDIQNLLSRNVSREDIAASVFHAVVIQILTSLSRGHEIEPSILLSGGPFTFLPYLRKAFAKELGVPSGLVILPSHSEVISAWGAAICSEKAAGGFTIRDYREKIEKSLRLNGIKESGRLDPLFRNESEMGLWKKEKERFCLPGADIADLISDECFIGIDSGSTTTKIVAADKEGRIFFHFYEKNRGDSLGTIEKGLSDLRKKIDRAGKELKVAGSCVTGYGEDLVRAAYPVDCSKVETIAHYMAARRFNQDVSFILDIGGQDMKAIFVKDGLIDRIEINEACSSGCGSFIEEFAKSLNHSNEGFSELAVKSVYPCDLGTRCTVFMNSKVKQSLREGAAVADIAAGLGYSVIRNCLFKVLKLKDFSELGDNIMVQGGSFRNISIIRALELETGKKVMITDFPELMGAYGAALHAIKACSEGKTRRIGLREMTLNGSLTSRTTICKGCENQCTVTVFDFGSGKKHYSGNKCEKIFCNTGSRPSMGFNIYSVKKDALFDRSPGDAGNRPRIGIPRVLGIFENYPFWHTLFSETGFETVLSDASTAKLYEKGAATVMSDNICFPAKIANGHVLNLTEKKVDLIFLPFVVYEKKDDRNSVNSYNCPIVTGYSEVLKSSIDTAGRHSIPTDSPGITFNDIKLLKKACSGYIRSLAPDIGQKKINEAFRKALREQEKYETNLAGECRKVVEKANAGNRLVILLAGRPYHTDPFIQHKISEIIAGFGADVISEDIARGMEFDTGRVQSITQWSYPNRILKAALWAADAPLNIHYVQLTSFGCGPDAFILDEVSDILKRKGKNATFLKIDDINNAGSTRLRIRSLLESLKSRTAERAIPGAMVINTPAFTRKESKRKILMPWFADFYSPFLPGFLGLSGYEAENLPPSDQVSAEFGLKYSNNEICYPATLVVGDIMKALECGCYDKDEIAIGMSQTGGQCRATSYLSLIKKALITSGNEDIPVISIALGSSIGNRQPGFGINWIKVYRSAIACMLYADYLSQMYYSTAPRETEPGIADSLKSKYINLGIEALKENASEKFFGLAGMMAADFAAANNRKEVPSIGIVGEIYVKYNNFAHKNLVNSLITQGIEPVVPPITNFFTDGFASQEARVSGNISRRKYPGFIPGTAMRYIQGMIDRMDSMVAAYPYRKKITDPYTDARNASMIINLNSQFGEGWRIPAELVHFAESGVNNVLSLQPFGCIANHIVSKGIEKRVCQLFPGMNILSLDFDSGVSDVNIYNRLHFMIRSALNKKPGPARHRKILSVDQAEANKCQYNPVSRPMQRGLVKVFPDDRK